jgi:hypothetical protein
MSNKIIKPILLVALMMSYSAIATVSAQDYEPTQDQTPLSGYVWDSESETPVSGVEVKLKANGETSEATDATDDATDTGITDTHQDLTATTDEEGYFTFENVEAGEYTVVVDNEMYESYETDVVVSDEEPVTLNILLNKSE